MCACVRARQVPKMTAVSDIFSIGPAGRAVRGSGEVVHCFCMQLINGNRVCVCVRARVFVFVRLCVCACVRACLYGCARACVLACVPRLLVRLRMPPRPLDPISLQILRKKRSGF